MRQSQPSKPLGRQMSIEAPLDSNRVIKMRAKDLQVQTLVDLGSLWQGIVDAKAEHGVGPGDEASMTKASGKHKSSRSVRSLERVVAREAKKCSRGFSRMATLVNRTEKIIEEEKESLKA